MTSVNTFEQAMVEFRMTQSTLGKYCGFETSRVSRGLTEEVPFTAEETQAIEQTIAAIRQLQREIQPPVPVDWSLIGRLKPLIEERKKAARDAADPVSPNFVAVKLSNGNYFQCVRAGQVITRPDPLSAAGFWWPHEADKVASELREKFGLQARGEIVPLRRRRSEMQTPFSVGIEEVERVAQ